MSGKINYIDISDGGFIPIYLGGQLSRYMINKNCILVGKYDNGYKVIAPSINQTGYRQYCLRVGANKFNKLEHRLVMEYFVGGKDAHKQINHINGIKTDNRLSNLEYCTPSQNIVHAYKLGLVDLSTRSGKYRPIKIGRYFANVLLREYKSVTLAEVDGYSRTSIHRHLNIDKSYRGFHWKKIS